jgi:hypothetical protein
MAARPTSTLTWQVSRTRMRVVHAGAQYALYFGLGLAVVSMLIGLNVFLASQTVALRSDIRELEVATDQTLFETTELGAYIAEQTNIYEIDIYTLTHGYSEADRFMYVQPLSTGQPWSGIFPPEPEDSAEDELQTNQMSASPAIDAVLNGLIDWVESPPQSDEVAWLK